MAGEKIRAFIAVDISGEARDALAQIVDRLKGAGASEVRWARPEGIHLTLKFLGDIDLGLVDDISSAMERATRGTGPFAIGLAGLGAFPSTANPRVIWAGLNGELDALKQLQARLDRELHSGLGFSLERRPFSPHLTLGRVRDGASGDARRSVATAIADVSPDSDVSWQVERLNLIRSTLAPSGAVYQLLGSVKL